MAVERQFLTLAEAAEEIGCTRRFLETRIEDGELRVFRPSTRLVRVRRAELERWIERYSFGGKPLV
jgi:excisionase family DNA binding protein